MTLPRKKTANYRLRVYEGIGAQGFTQVVQILIRVAEVPLFFKLWGPARYGEWLMITTIPIYLAMCDGGFKDAACKQMSMLSSAGDQKGALCVFQSTWVLLLGISFIVILGAAGVLHVLPLVQWFHLVHIGAPELEMVLLLLLVHVLVELQAGLLYGAFWCTGRYPLGMVLTAMTQLLEFAGLAMAVTLGGGPVAAAAGYLSGRLFGTLLTGAALKYAAPFLHYGVGRASVKTLRALLAPAIASLAFPLGNALHLQGTRLMVGIVLGPAAVAVFAPLRTLSRFVMQPRAIVNQIIMPELALAFGSGDKELFGRLFTKSCQTALWTSIAMIPLLAAGAYGWFPFWTGGQLQLHWPLYILLLWAAAANSLWYTALMVPYATNRHGALALKYAVIYGLAAVLIGYYGTLRFGLTGTGMALVVVEIAMALCVIPTAITMGNTSMHTWLGTICRPPLFLLTEGVHVFGRIQQILFRQRGG